MVKLSKFEKDLLESMKGASTIKTVVNSDHWFGRKYPDKTTDNCYQAIANIKKKFVEAQAYVGLIHAYRGLSPLLKKRLTIRVPQKEEESGEE